MLRATRIADTTSSSEDFETEITGFFTITTNTTTPTPTPLASDLVKPRHLRITGT
jgi:hypothetical protein